MTSTPGYSVLVVEAESIVATDISEKLERAGYQICGIADNAAAALSAIRDRAPDLVLLDVQLKGEVDGIDIAFALRRFCDSPLIFLSSHAERETLARAKALVPDGYLIKPVREESLTAAVEMAIHRSHHERARRSDLLVRAFRDELTGTYNRRFLIEQCPANFTCQKNAVVFCLCDLDHFKLVNDTLGHVEGDLALRRFATYLNNAVGDRGFVCRIGGDEFGVMFSERELLSGGVDLDTLREGFALENHGSLVPLTCSLGACMKPAGTPVLDLLHSADEALYRSKRAGGNQISWAVQQALGVPLSF